MVNNSRKRPAETPADAERATGEPEKVLTHELATDGSHSAAAAEPPQSELAILKKSGMLLEFITSLKVDESDEMPLGSALGLFRVLPKASQQQQCAHESPDSVSA